MSELDYSFERVITGVVGGLIISSVYVWLVNLGFLPGFVLFLVQLASVGVWFVLIRNISSWSFTYLVGWVLGVVVVYQAGLVSGVTLILYGLIMALGLWMRATHEQYHEKY